MTTAQTSRALSTLKLNAIWIQRERLSKALNSVVNDRLKSSSVLTFSFRSSCLARSVMRARRLDKTPSVAAIPVIKKTGATAVWITFAIVKMLMTSEFILSRLAFKKTIFVYKHLQLTVFYKNILKTMSLKQCCVYFCGYCNHNVIILLFLFVVPFYIDAETQFQSLSKR